MQNAENIIDCNLCNKKIHYSYLQKHIEEFKTKINK